jgi:hypothetical protein
LFSVQEWSGGRIKNATVRTALVGPSEVSELLLKPRRFPPRIVLPGELLVQSYCPLKYRLYWLGDPTLPLAVSSAMWFSLSGPRWPQLSEQRIHSSSLASQKVLPSRT